MRLISFLAAIIASASLVAASKKYVPNYQAAVVVAATTTAMTNEAPAAATTVPPPLDPQEVIEVTAEAPVKEVVSPAAPAAPVVDKLAPAPAQQKKVESLPASVPQQENKVVIVEETKPVVVEKATGPALVPQPGLEAESFSVSFLDLVLPRNRVVKRAACTDDSQCGPGNLCSSKYGCYAPQQLPSCSLVDSNFYGGSGFCGLKFPDCKINCVLGGFCKNEKCSAKVTSAQLEDAPCVYDIECGPDQVCTQNGCRTVALYPKCRPDNFPDLCGYRMDQSCIQTCSKGRACVLDRCEEIRLEPSTSTTTESGPTSTPTSTSDTASTSTLTTGTTSTSSSTSTSDPTSSSSSTTTTLTTYSNPTETMSSTVAPSSVSSPVASPLSSTATPSAVSVSTVGSQSTTTSYALFCSKKLEDVLRENGFCGEIDGCVISCPEGFDCKNSRCVASNGDILKTTGSSNTSIEIGPSSSASQIASATTAKPTESASSDNVSTNGWTAVTSDSRNSASPDITPIVSTAPPSKPTPPAVFLPEMPRPE
ncbi:hypothetical protein BDR26DRAFT_1007434, partial [Obelidium mucronatum]